MGVSRWSLVCAWPLALLPGTFGIGNVANMLAFTENIEVRSILTTNSLTALKRFVAVENFVTLMRSELSARAHRLGKLPRDGVSARCGAAACQLSPGSTFDDGRATAPLQVQRYRMAELGCWSRLTIRSHYRS